MPYPPESYIPRPNSTRIESELFNSSISTIGLVTNMDPNSLSNQNDFMNTFVRKDLSTGLSLVEATSWTIAGIALRLQSRNLSTDSITVTHSMANFDYQLPSKKRLNPLIRAHAEKQGAISIRSFEMLTDNTPSPIPEKELHIYTDLQPDTVPFKLTDRSYSIEQGREVIYPLDAAASIFNARQFFYTYQELARGLVRIARVNQHLSSQRHSSTMLDAIEC